MVGLFDCCGFPIIISIINNYFWLWLLDGKAEGLALGHQGMQCQQFVNSFADVNRATPTLWFIGLHINDGYEVDWIVT